MNKPIQIRFVAFVGAAVLAISGLRAQPLLVYAGTHPPTGSYEQRVPVPLASLLAVPQGISTSPGGQMP